LAVIADDPAPPAYCETKWVENTAVAKLIYKLSGYTAREQFARGIVEQPGWLENWLICSELRRVYGDISDIPGFDRKSNFIRDRHNDILIPQYKGPWIAQLQGYSSRTIAKQSDIFLQNSCNKTAI
jgi:hypothetical protein